MEFQSKISLDLLSNSTKILENLCCENNKTRKHTFPLTCWQAINIRLKLLRGNLVNWWSLVLLVGLDQNGLLCVSTLIDVTGCASIDYCLWMSTIGLARWSDRMFSPIISKMLQNHHFLPNHSWSYKYTKYTV